MSTTSQVLAQASAAAMWQDDRASQSLGMTIDEIAPGRARLSMAISAMMINGHGTCHGGYIFLLADSAFAFACNSHNHVSVAQSCTISFVKPAREGDVLVAEAVEFSRPGRSGLTDVTVRNQHGEDIAFFRGQSRSLGGAVIKDPPAG